MNDGYDDDDDMRYPLLAGQGRSGKGEGEGCVTNDAEVLFGSIVG